MKHFPFLCKATAYGKAVNCFGRYPTHKVAIAPDTPDTRAIIYPVLEDIFKIPFTKCSWPACTVAATNQILHPAILAEIFKGHSPAKPLVSKEHMMFYKALGREAGESMTELYMNEFPAIGIALNELYACAFFD
jgi:hypothetical protein